ncbi:xanthine dehydrogenase family protein molybdopterin-binding subunit [Nisaea sediminum]|uniref:xanthine dehydrogenase family protein molybdopterin-binding subunit n=1 Tax=Nisaea sediminum TaxID=2775867 RepID=UPI001866993F|nr:molybdopterin cofactor-binding domain-containing protein [Nisaea sediminum]
MLKEIERLNAPARELSAPRTALQNVSRRGFLGGATGLVVALQFLPGEAGAYQPYPHGGQSMPHGVVNDPHVFVAIDPDGTVTLVAHRSEMGTGSRTTIPMIMADEMEADWNRVRIVQAPGDEPKYGNQDTDGSRSLRHHIQPARDIGAAVRLMLEQAAAKEWGVDPSEVEAVNHQVVHKALGRRLGYGELAKAAMDLPTPPRESLAYKDERSFRYIGKGTVQITDLHDITTGAAVYGADVSLPGMKYAVIARPPVVNGRVKSFDSKAAMAVNGVERVEEIAGSTMPAKFAPLGGVAVIASSTWAALKGREALKIEWEAGPNGSYDTAAYRKALSASAAASGKVVRDQGDADGALKSAARVFTREYYQPHMPHAPMEPPAALASVKDGKCEVWACVQSPYGTRVDVASALGMKEEDVTVNVTLLGGGFGRKSKCDFVIEAALLSRAVGAPVRVQWTREDDIRHSFYHTTSVERIEIGLDGDNRPVAWRHRSAAPSFLALFAPDSGHMHPIEVGMGLADMPYDIPNVRCEDCEAKAHTRVGWYRSVSNIPRAFAVQSVTAELAHELGRDQKDFLLEMIGPGRVIDRFAAGVLPDFWNYGEPYEEFPNDTARLRNVIELAARKAGWGKSLPEGEALGIAAHRSFVTYVATAVRVKVEKDGTLRVPETHVAIDCGYVANPERVRSQVQGACVFGMSAAMHGGVTFENGAVVESNFHDYRMARANDFPLAVQTHIVEHPFEVHATGVGEPGVPPFLPALTNAIFNATGKRIRDLPIGGQLKA